MRILHPIRRALLATFCVTFSVVLLAVPAGASAASQGCADDASGITDSTAAWEAQLLELTNAHRTGMDLVALKLDTTLTRASVWKARDMARRDYFAHDDQANGDAPARSPWDRLAACGWTTGGARAENIAAGYSSAASVIEGWLNSPGHRANIENASMRYVGFGVASSPSSQWGTYSVQMLASVAGPASTTPISQPPADGGDGTTTDEPTRDPLADDDARIASQLTISASTVTRSRCRGRLAVAGWCYQLTVRGTLAADAANIAGRSVVVSRRTASGRLVRLAARATAVDGSFVISGAVRPPATRTAAWLRANAIRLRVGVAGTELAQPTVAWPTARLLLRR